jgi:hypothetical protein
MLKSKNNIPFRWKSLHQFVACHQSSVKKKSFLRIAMQKNVGAFHLNAICVELFSWHAIFVLFIHFFSRMSAIKKQLAQDSLDSPRFAKIPFVLAPLAVDLGHSAATIMVVLMQTSLRGHYGTLLSGLPWAHMLKQAGKLGIESLEAWL